jgi:hypothetical protein
VANARDRIIAELVEDFIEERVRHSSKKAFNLPAVKKGLQESLKGTEAAMQLSAADDRVILAALDGHPFVVRGKKPDAFLEARPRHLTFKEKVIGSRELWRHGARTLRSGSIHLPLIKGTVLLHSRSLRSDWRRTGSALAPGSPSLPIYLVEDGYQPSLFAASLSRRGPEPFCCAVSLTCRPVS